MKRRALLRNLGSLRAVRNASEEELAAVPGISARDAATIHGFFAALVEKPVDSDEAAPAPVSPEGEPPPRPG